MGIRCSLLGHDYGESFVERDREERGNEVVVTERELRECRRCGAEHVTSENTEVRPIQPEPEPTPDVEASAEAAPTTDAADAGAPSTDADPDAGEGGAFTSATEVIEQAEAGMSGDAEASDASVDETAADDRAAEPGDDDAVILDDDADDATPGSDQWDEPADPEVDPDDPGTPTPDPDDEDVEFVGSADTDEPADADPSQHAGGDAVADAASGSEGARPDAGGATTDPATESSDDLDRDRGEWPEPDGEDEGFDATPGDDPAGEVSAATADADAETGTFEFGEEPAAEPDPAEETGFTSAGPVDQAGTDDLDFTLFCPECGFERYAAGSSLRAGDICPECKRGYLGEDR